jgi:hypothetical protein
MDPRRALTGARRNASRPWIAGDFLRTRRGRTVPFSTRGIRTCAAIFAIENQMLKYPNVPSRVQIETVQVYHALGLDEPTEIKNARQRLH